MDTKSKHIILECWDINSDILKDKLIIENIINESANQSRATILHNHFHHFGENFGVTGVLVLSESHISIHTWPENNYAAIDIFMCGKCDPIISMNYILKEFDCNNYNALRLDRGNLNYIERYIIQ